MSKGNLKYLFPSDTPNVSNEFQLLESVGVVSFDGLQAGDCVCVEIFVGDECDGRWIPFNPTCCGQVCMAHPQNQLYLVMPNKYRLTLSNKDDMHITDPSWFENLVIFFEPVESDVDLTQYIQGALSMACGPNVSVSCDPTTGSMTVVVDGNSCTVTPGSTVTTATLPDGTQIITVDGGTPIVIPPQISVACDPAGIMIDGVLCPFPTTQVVSVVDNGDCTGTITVDGVSVDFLTEEKDLHDPASLSSTDGVFTIASTGQSFDLTFVESVAATQLASDAGAMSVITNAIVGNPANLALFESALAPILEASTQPATDPTNGGAASNTQAVLDNLNAAIAASADDDVTAVSLEFTATGLAMTVTEGATSHTDEVTFAELATSLAGNAAFVEAMAIALIDPQATPINELTIGTNNLLFVNS